MIITLFGSWILAAIVLFLAQKPKEKRTRILLRTLGFLLFLWPFIQGILNNYIFKK
ncbi:hypothetical protein KKC63_01495 [Patescibacteria group bacterium]|nr:hypothetical protein [Patescibacteria group bacterium]MBU4023057.1 hypothetical protein [Patescibacteria group bacterium]